MRTCLATADTRVASRERALSRCGVWPHTAAARIIFNDVLFGAKIFRVLARPLAVGLTGSRRATPGLACDAPVRRAPEPRTGRAGQAPSDHFAFTKYLIVFLSAARSGSSLSDSVSLAGHGGSRSFATFSLSSSTSTAHSLTDTLTQITVSRLSSDPGSGDRAPRRPHARCTCGVLPCTVQC